MTQDPIVEEVRKTRQSHASRFHYDAQAIYDDLKRKENASTRKIVSYSPKHPVRAASV